MGIVVHRDIDFELVDEGEVDCDTEETLCFQPLGIRLEVADQDVEYDRDCVLVLSGDLFELKELLAEDIVRLGERVVLFGFGDGLIRIISLHLQVADVE